MPKLACFRTKHAEIYAFFWVSFHFCLIHACVIELTYIMSDHAIISVLQQQNIKFSKCL